MSQSPDEMKTLIRITSISHSCSNHIQIIFKALTEGSVLSCGSHKYKRCTSMDKNKECWLQTFLYLLHYVIDKSSRSTGRYTLPWQVWKNILPQECSCCCHTLVSNIHSTVSDCFFAISYLLFTKSPDSNKKLRLYLRIE